MLIDSNLNADKPKTRCGWCNKASVAGNCECKEDCGSSLCPAALTEVRDPLSYTMI